MKTFWTPEADFKVIVVVGGNENPSLRKLPVGLQRKASEWLHVQRLDFTSET
jgi:hypothetical protein